MHALLTFMQSGDNFLSASELYGGTYTQFKYSFANLGIEARFFNAANPDEAASLIDENTKCIYLETISNPSSTVPDFEKYVEICVEINQCVGCTRQYFTKSFLGDDAAVLARSGGEEPESPRHRAGVASMAWRSMR